MGILINSGSIVAKRTSNLICADSASFESGNDNKEAILPFHDHAQSQLVVGANDLSGSPLVQWI